ncbi:MAG TPA: MASE1 domain-containing protein [Candidatus Eremiobacteraceae bacterium]|jgi:PAS domain S-box-containing protein
MTATPTERSARKTGIDLPYVLSILVLAALYVGAAKVGFSLAFATKQITAVWPPTGIAVAALLLLGYRVWPGIFLGAVIANAMTHEPAYTAAGIAIGNALAPLLAAAGLKRLVEFDVAMERLRDVLGFVLVGSALAMTVSATNGVFSLALAGIVPWSAFGSNWWLWWVGDSMGVLLVAPLLLTWLSRKRAFILHWRDAIEIVALAAAVIATTWLLFVRAIPFAYPLYPFVIWAALRFGQRATSAAVVVISSIAIWGTIHGLGPFSTGSPDHRLIMLVTFMAGLSVTGLVLGAITAERRLAGEQLEAAEHRFHVLAEIVPQIVWTADATGWIDWYNHRWYEYTGQSPDEAAGWGWQTAHHPEDFPRVMQDWPRSIATGAPFDMESRIRRKDGEFRWFLLRAEPWRDARGSIERWYGTNTDIDDQKRTLQNTTRVAETLQGAFLPGRLPVRSDFRFDALYLAAEREALIGGDWYDAFELPDGHVIVSIGDVMGHGVSAAVAAARIRQGIFAVALDTADPSAILAKVNRMVTLQGNSVATALVAIIDPNLSKMRYASAGHPPPILATPRAHAASLSFGGLPLGVTADLALENFDAELERGAVILFYTDGVTEIRRNIESAETVLMNELTKLVGDSDNPRPAAAIQRAVMGADRPTDDAVIMVLQLSSVVPGVRVDDAALQKSWTFHSSDAYSAHKSRHELMGFIRGLLSSEDDLFRIELIIGEVLANTVKHAPGLVTVDIDWSGAQPALTIIDTGPGLVRFSPSLPSDGLHEEGRGLFLIGTLAHDVRVERMPDSGTKMTVDLPVNWHQNAGASPVRKERDPS